MAFETLTALKASHPMPWGYVTIPGTGTLVLLDSHGKEVPLLTVLDFMTYITGKI